MSAPPKTLENTGQTGIFPKNSAKAYWEPLNQRQSQNPLKPPWQPALRAAVNGIGAEKRQCLSPAPISVHRKSAKSCSKSPGALSLSVFAPARAHSGSQGRTRGFCDLCRQLLLHLLTLQLGHLPLVTLLQDIVHRDDIRYAPGDVKSGRMTEVFSIAICHIPCYNALKLNNGAA